MDVVDLTGASPLQCAGGSSNEAALCGLDVPGGLEALQAHCDAHFEDGPAVAEPVADEQPVPCDQCGAYVHLREFESHHLAHALEQEELLLAGAGMDAEALAQRERQEEQEFERLQARYGFVQEVGSAPTAPASSAAPPAPLERCRPPCPAAR